MKNNRVENPESTVQEKITSEKESVEWVIRFYCRKKHKQKELCGECQELLDYAYRRLERCPYMENKHFCSNCPTHCYKKDMRERIREVMRFTGPRLLWYRPNIAIKHMIETFKKKGAKDENTARKN